SAPTCTTWARYPSTQPAPSASFTPEVCAAEPTGWPQVQPELLANEAVDDGHGQRSVRAHADRPIGRGQRSTTRAPIVGDRPKTARRLKAWTARGLPRQSHFRTEQPNLIPYRAVHKRRHAPGLALAGGPLGAQHADGYQQPGQRSRLAAGRDRGRQERR